MQGTLIRELNEEQLQAVPQRADSEMLRTAGHLCAVQLLSGQVGYRLPIRTDNVDDYIDLRDIQERPQETLLVTLHTKVFDVTDGLAKPIHQHIAEFLAGRYLSALIEGGLPVRAGPCPAGRRRRANRIRAPGLGSLVGCSQPNDPSTTSSSMIRWERSYTAMSRCSPLTRNAACSTSWNEMRRVTPESSALCMIWTRDGRASRRLTWNMCSDEILTTTGGSQGRQTVAFAVLRSLERGAVIPRLTPMLLDLVRDSKSWSPVREAALEAYIQQSSNREDAADHELTTLLADVYTGSVSDPDDQVLGLLLMRLFPGTLPPAGIGRFLRERKIQRPRRTVCLLLGGCVGRAIDG